jgi:hypothetical protein
MKATFPFAPGKAARAGGDEISRTRTASSVKESGDNAARDGTRETMRVIDNPLVVLLLASQLPRCWPVDPLSN